MGSSKGLLQWAIQTFDFPPTQIHPTTRQSSFQCHSVIWWWFLQIWWLCINGDNWELVKRWSRCSGEKMSFSKPITPDGANITSMIAFSTEHCHIPSLFVCLRVTLEVSSCKSCRSANPLHILSFTDCSCWSTIATIPMLILINNRNTGHSIRRATFADNLLPVPLMISTVRRGSIPYPTRIPSLPTTRFCNPESPQSFSIFVNEKKTRFSKHVCFLDVCFLYILEQLNVVSIVFMLGQTTRDYWLGIMDWSTSLAQDCCNQHRFDTILI